jgi:hypothetical protein
MHLTHTLGGCLLAEFLHTILFKSYKSAVATGNVAIETIPKLIELTRSGSQRGPYLHGVITGVGRTAATLEAVIGTEVAIGPEVEWVRIPAVAERGIGCVDHLVRLGISEVAVDNARGRDIDEAVARGEGDKS